MLKQESVVVATTQGRGTYEITEQVARIVRAAGITTGLCHVFVHHTSASLMLCENADPSVRRDLERFMSALAPDGDRRYEHDDEGPDDMAAHIRTVITQTGLTIPVTGGALALGTWQGIYLWEHRHQAHRRQITVTVAGG
ncbi:MAG: secondary thiamine-phosphate synthase enzyme YjbQ [Pseudomonadota bacterium]